MDWLITGLILAPAVWLAATRSTWLLDYAIVVLAFNRGLRRIVDYYINGQFNPLSPISLTPLVVAGLLLFPAVVYFGRLPGRSRVPFFLLAGALAFGLIVGLVNNRFAAIYSLGEWISALAAMAFAASMPAAAVVADRWIKTAGWCAVGVAAYGWWQYYTIPPWDAMWLVQSGMAGYMGIPEPTKMTVFSTLNERGPFGGFLAWAVIPMIIEPRWRNVGGWFTVALLLSGIVLSQTRSNLIIIAVVAIIYPMLSRGRSLGRVLALCALVVAGGTWGVQKLPGMEKMAERFEEESIFGKGSSLQGRLQIYHFGIKDVIRSPAGLGLGSSGMGNRVEGGKVKVVGDSGYIQIFVQFGWIGAALFFGCLWMLWRIASWRWKLGARILSPPNVDPFIPATRAILLGSLVFLFVGDIFAGFSLLWVFFGRSLSLHTDPALLIRRLVTAGNQEASPAGLPEPLKV